MTRALSMHATYGCRERGACCTAGWPIPIETDRLALIERARRDGRMATTRVDPFVREAGAPPETPALLATVEGGCVFHRTSGTGRCDLHRTLGHAALPLACRQFPRVSVVDPRGVSITLSHYCPTAAGLLDTAEALTICDSPPAFPAHGEYVGLDARAELPPLLRPGMLMDWESWWHWEREIIALLDLQESADEAMARLRTAVDRVRDWTPADGPLRTRIDEGLDIARRRPVARAGDRPADRQRLTDEVLEAIPEELRNTAARVVRRAAAPAPPRARTALLAAHAFANWTAHLGQGLRSWRRSLEVVHVLSRDGLGVRDVDLLLRHLADPHALARVWIGAERPT